MGKEGYGALLSVGHWSKIRLQNSKGANYIYMTNYRRGVLFSPVSEIFPDLPAISVRSWQQWSLGQNVWFGWLSAISQLASRVGVGGERESAVRHILSIPLLSQVVRAGRGLWYLPSNVIFSHLHDDGIFNQQTLVQATKSPDLKNNREQAVLIILNQFFVDEV